MWRELYQSLIWLNLAAILAVSAAAGEPLPGTAALTETRPLDVVMVEGIDRFASRELERAREQRPAIWKLDYSTLQAHQQSLAAHRDRFAKILGVVDPRTDASGIEFIATTMQPSLVHANKDYTVDAVRWPVLDGITAEGLWLRPTNKAIARVVAIPDADWTPEMIVGLEGCQTRFAADLAALGCEVLVPMLINRDHRYSGNPDIGRQTNLTHREFIYRQAFEVGRHVIGYEVQKVLAAIDQFELRNQQSGELPLAVCGVGEGGMFALYSAALDPRIDHAVVSGYFDRRERIWTEPIYRNVWGLLVEFGDAEIAGMIAPRSLSIEPTPAIVAVPGPPTAARNVAAPGAITSLDRESVDQEIDRAGVHWTRLKASFVETIGKFERIGARDPSGPPLATPTLRKIVGQLAGSVLEIDTPAAVAVDQRLDFSADQRQKRQLDEMVEFTQRRLQLSHRERERRFAAADRSSPQAWQRTAEPLRNQVYDELIGRLPDPTIAPGPRSRRILDEPTYTGYEVVLDVYPDVIAAGILLMPKDLRPGEKRPVVVCQHGLEGTPMDTIEGPDSKAYRAYKSFSVALVNQGFIVYAPQNPYRGQDAFRTLQRKSNPLARSLFSYIIPQHAVTLRWLATLPEVDRDRIGFYGLSYGGKTAMRVPPLLPPTATQPGYCLSICSADFNEWVAKNASTDAPFSYLWTGEYEIFEWNMAHVANYAELAMLMTPRPFMVERGHDDGVGIDEWVAWEYAKVRRHYNQLGLGDKTEIEFFDGPHTINGKGTFEFLGRHLQWPR